MNAAFFPDLVVNGETVPHTAIASEAQNHEGPKGKPGVAWRKAAHAMAVRTLLLQEAHRQALTADPAEVAPGRFETDEEALIRAVLEGAVDAAPPTEEAVKAEWARNPDRFRAPPLWEVSHILIACDPCDEAGRDAAKAKAQAVLEEALAAPRTFAKLAETHSECGSASTGGQLGQMTPGDAVPEFEAALREMSEGEISPAPVLSRHGWHIIRMDGLAVGAVLPFEAVRPHIALAMEKAAWAKASRAFVEQLMEAADIQGLPKRPDA